MSKIFKMTLEYKSTEEYRKSISETIQELESIELTLNNLIVSLATSGKWKEWSDKQPIGTEFYFTEEMLIDTEDDNINSIIELKDQLITLIKKLSMK